MSPYVLYDKGRALQNCAWARRSIQNRPKHFSPMKCDLEHEKHTEIILDSNWHSKHHRLSSFGVGSKKNIHSTWKGYKILLLFPASYVCGTRFSLYASTRTTNWMQKQLWGHSCLLLSHMLRRLDKKVKHWHSSTHFLF